MRRLLGVVVLVTIMGVGLVQAAPLYFTGTAGNQIWVAETDGSGSPSVLFSPAASDSSGPVGIQYIPSTGLIYYAGGNEQEAWVANADGSGAPTLLLNSTDFGAFFSRHDVAVDLVNDRIFYSAAYGPGGTDGVFWGNLDGSGTASALPNTTTPSTYGPSSVVYDPTTDRVYYNNVGDTSDDYLGSEISVINADGSGAPTVLFDSSDGLIGVRDMVIDVASNKIYWVEFLTGSGPAALKVGNLDGSGTPATLFTSSTHYMRGIDLDASTGLLYWTEFQRAAGFDRIMTGNADGTGAPTVLYSGDFGRLRGISVGQDSGAIVTPEPLSMVFMGSTCVCLAAARLRKRRRLGNG